MNRRMLVSMAAAAATAMGYDAHAESAHNYYFQNASGVCQPALPAFEGSIRKRPTAVANEGTSNAFVSCSAPTASGAGSEWFGTVVLVVYNRNAFDVDITCSFIHNFRTGGPIVPRTLTVEAGQREFFEWTTDDVGFPTQLRYANFNCNLMPGTEVGYVFYPYTYEIGL